MPLHSTKLELTKISVVYELVQHANFLFNRSVDVLFYFLSSEHEWDEPAKMGQGLNALSTINEEQLESIKANILAEKDVAFKEADLIKLYDSLPAVNCREVMVGRVWDGRVLRTNGSLLELAELFLRPLSYLGVGWGKRFTTQYAGDPLLFNLFKRIYIPLASSGSSSLSDVTWRNVTTATMCYNSQNWKDYFRILHHDEANRRIVLLGTWTSWNKMGGFFTLTWDPETPVQ